ncbi:MAG: hypothetical protein GX491_03990 [Chloroflexi bacterium]|nr:hypothetical protein [Chloroflexota bacterium]
MQVTFPKNQILIGDNLQILPRLRETHAGLIQAIYADPPYGRATGDTPYDDTLADPDAWVRFLRPRLIMARDLLSRDGVFMASIDDSKPHYLRLLLDEVFGAKNFVNTIIWHYGGLSRHKPYHIRTAHEYVYVYAKELSQITINPVRVEKYRYQGMIQTVRQLSRKLGFAFDEGLAALGFYRDPDTGEFFECYHNRTGSRCYLTGPLDDVWYIPQINRMARERVRGYLGQKPVALIKQLLQVYGKQTGIVLDLFAGTGTTGEAVVALNHEDGGERAFILIQSAEACRDPVLIAQGYEKISDILVSRMQRLSEKYPQQDKNPLYCIDTFES